MTTVETEPVLDEFDLDIQIDETDLPARKYAPQMWSRATVCGSCTGCCTGTNCSDCCDGAPPITQDCSSGCVSYPQRGCS
jgi:hypothetical protein